MAEPRSDFRSDTVTRPSPAMRRAMAEAQVGDDVFGDDPTVIELERRAAELFAKEAAVLLPSGTMANQAAVRTHCRAGDEVLLHEGAHMYRFEQGGLAALHGVQAVPLAGEGGRIPVELLRQHLRPSADPHFARTRLVALENTHNLCGGCVLPLAYVEEVGDFAREAGLRFHVDGARIMNAAVALGIEVAALAAPADSVTLCLSKGLGAPVGTLLMGGAEFILGARRARKVLGGGMRQAGVLAAPALVALDEARQQLGEDHRRAAALAAGLSALDGADVIPPETNIVVVSLPGRDPQAVVGALGVQGVLAVPFGPGRLRLTTHRDVGDRDVERALAAFATALEEVPRS